MIFQTYKQYTIILLPIIISTLVCFFVYSSPKNYRFIERKHYDHLLKEWQPEQKITNKITLVGIDEKSFRLLNERPIKRSTHTHFIDLAKRIDIFGIVWDIIFESQHPDDEAFSKSIEQVPCFFPFTGDMISSNIRKNKTNNKSEIIKKFGYRPDASFEKKINPWPVKNLSVTHVPNDLFIKSIKNIGHVNSRVDKDGILRKIPLIVKVEDRYFPSLGLAAALQILGASIDDIYFKNKNTLVIANKKANVHINVPVDDSCSLMLYPVKNWQNYIDILPYAQFYKTLKFQTKIVNDSYKDKLIIIGKNYTNSGDLINTSLERNQPGLLSIFFIINSLLQGQFITPSPKKLDIILIFCLPLILVIFHILDRPLITFISYLLIISSIYLLSVLLFRLNLYYLSISGPFFALTFTVILLFLISLFLNHRKTKALSDILTRFVSPALFKELKEYGYNNISKCIKREKLTVLFADIAGSTAFTEFSAPEDVAKFLANFYEIAISAIEKNKGTLDNLLGDGVIAYWGAPEPDDQKENNALNAATLIRRDFKKINKRLKIKGISDLGLRIGIASGYATVGYIGNKKHAAYTALGPTVNLAARLESMSENGQILVDQRTYSGLDTTFILKQHGTITPKGFKKAVTIWILDTN